VAALALLLPAVAGAGDADVACLKLRPQASVCGDTVTLGDVLEFGDGTEQLAEQIAPQPAVADPHAQSPATIAYDQIVKRLEELGVNLSRVLLSGATRCEITRHANAQPLVANPQSPIVNPQSSVRNPKSTGPRTLADVLRAQADADLAPLGGTADIGFERAGQEFLRVTTPPWEFQVSSSDRDKLGLRTFRVLIRRDGQVQRKADVVAQVRLVRPVVVARRPLNPGNCVRSEDVGVETRVFEQNPGSGPTRIEEIVGQPIKRFVPEGERVTTDAIKVGELVARARPVTITGENAGIQVRLTGIALDSGGYGDTIRVRLGDSRRERKMLHGVVTGLGTVRLAEGNP
jgi:flagella basal body P-ring formation protein FlgA